MSKVRILLEVDAEPLEKWKKIDALAESADDHTICRECGDQVVFCDCTWRLAYNVLCSAVEVGKDEQFFNYALHRFDPDGPYWILKRGASGWVRLDRFIEEGDAS